MHAALLGGKEGREVKESLDNVANVGGFPVFDRSLQDAFLSDIPERYCPLRTFRWDLDPLIWLSVRVTLGTFLSTFLKGAGCRG